MNEQVQKTYFDEYVFGFITFGIVSEIYLGIHIILCTYTVLQ